MPLVEGDTLGRAHEGGRDRARADPRARARAAGQVGQGVACGPGQGLHEADRRPLQASKWLGTETAKQQARHGRLPRAAAPRSTFLFFRLVAPIGLLSLRCFYLFVLDDPGLSHRCQVGIVIGGAYLGVKAPEIFLSNTISKRQKSMRRAWPDALDLLLICVESGMSIEQAFRKVRERDRHRSPCRSPRNSTLTTAELSYLPDRRQAYREPRQAHRPRTREGDHHRAHPGGALRHAARAGAARAGAGRAATSA